MDEITPFLRQCWFCLFNLSQYYAMRRAYMDDFASLIRAFELRSPSQSRTSRFPSFYPSNLLVSYKFVPDSGEEMVGELGRNRFRSSWW